jgi:uncharacterized protein (UPF0332 family)
MEKAAQAVVSARLLADSGDADGACNRSYYAMFQAAKAALISSGLEPDSFKTHSFTIAAFGKTFVLTGQIAKEIGRAISEVEKIRAIADYAAAPVPIERAIWAANQADLFVSSVKTLSVVASAVGNDQRDGAPRA